MAAGLSVGREMKLKKLANIKKTYTTESGGIIPIEAAKHHSKIKYENFNREYHYVLVMFFCGISSPFSEKILQIKML